MTRFGVGLLLWLGLGCGLAAQTRDGAPVDDTAALADVSKTDDLFALLAAARSDPSRITLSFASGGASGANDFGSLGHGEPGCAGFGDTPSLTVTGAYSAAPAISLEQLWWGTKYPVCELLPHLEWGDMLYLLADGFAPGETLQGTLSGPDGQIEITARVEDITHPPAGGCAPPRQAARIALLLSPDLGAGELRLEIRGSAGRIGATFEVSAPRWPKYGLQAGVDGHPLILTGDEQLRLVFAGFPPNATTKTAVFRDTVSVSDLAMNDPVPPPQDLPFSVFSWAFDVTVNDHGWAVVPLSWPDQLQPGLYSFMNMDVADPSKRAPADRHVGTFQGGSPDPSNPDVTLGSAYATIQISARPDLERGSFVLRSDGYQLHAVPNGEKFFLEHWKVVGVASDDVLNVRDVPKGAKVGELHHRAENVLVIDRREDAGSSPWVLIDCGDFGPAHGWVNSRFLARQD